MLQLYNLKLPQTTIGVEGFVDKEDFKKQIKKFTTHVEINGIL